MRYFFKNLLKNIIILFSVSIFLISIGNYAYAENFTDPVVIFDTNYGEIVISFFPSDAPNHVENFVTLSKSGFYDGTLFHRIIPGFMIQGGDPNTKTDNKGSWGMGGPGYNVKAEFSSRSHLRGIVSMARAQDPDSAGSQFFIVTSDSAFLDRQYTVFGQVKEGMDVADKIVNMDKDGNDCPLEKVVMTKITLSKLYKQVFLKDFGCILS